VIIKIVGFVLIKKTIHISESILQVNTFLHNKYFTHKILDDTNKCLSPNTSQIVKNDSNRLSWKIHDKSM